MNKTLVDIGLGYAFLAAWVPFLWVAKVVLPEPASFLGSLFFLLFAGLGFMGSMAINDLQTRFDDAKRDLRCCRSYVKLQETIAREEDEDWKKHLEKNHAQLRRQLDEIERRELDELFK